MKTKGIYSTLAILCMASVTLFSQGSDNFSPSGKLFGLLYTGYHSAFTGGKNSSGFEIGRSYLGYDHHFSKKFSGRILYDGTTQSVSGKTIYSGYLRNAYLQYDNGTVLLRGGMIGMEQISMMEKIWGYRFLSRPPIDYSGMTFPADIGVMTLIRATEYLDIDVAVTNGRGYKDLSPNGTYRLSTGFTLTPAGNILVRGFFDMMGPSGRIQRTASLTAAWMGSAFNLGAEYFRQDNASMDKGRNYSGISIFTRVPVIENTFFFARFDHISSVTMRGNSNPWNYGGDGSYLVTGIDYSPVKNIRLSPNYNFNLPSADGRDPVHILGFNLEAKF